MLVHLKLQTYFVLPGLISVLCEKHNQLCNIVKSFQFMPVESKQNKNNTEIVLYKSIYRHIQINI